MSLGSYIYHNTGLGASHFIRSKGVLVSQYTDDRHMGQLGIPKCFPSDWSNLDLAKSGCFIAALMLVSKLRKPSDFPVV